MDEHNYVSLFVHPYEVDDIDSCVSVVTERFVLGGHGTEEDAVSITQPVCNGETIYGYDFDYVIKTYMQVGMFTEEELVEANVIKEKVIEEVELCMPKKPVKLSTYITKILNNAKFLNNGLVQTYATVNGQQVGKSNSIKFLNMNSLDSVLQKRCIGH